MTNLIIFGGGSFLTEVLEYIEDFLETRISIISIGPGRNEIINRL